MTSEDRAEEASEEEKGGETPQGTGGDNEIALQPESYSCIKVSPSRERKMNGRDGGELRKEHTL